MLLAFCWRRDLKSNELSSDPKAGMIGDLHLAFDEDLTTSVSAARADRKFIEPRSEGILGSKPGTTGG
jgi:hypothetical protein